MASHTDEAAYQPSTWKKIASALKLGPHYAIERFGVLVLVFMVTLAVLVGLSWHTAWRANNQLIGDQAVYTQTFQTSRTGAKGKINGVYVNPDKTKTMLLMQFENPAQMSTRPDDYLGFLTAVNGSGNETSLKSEPTASIHTFGTSGFLGVMLQDVNGFDNQVMQLTMRNKVELGSLNSNAGAQMAKETGDDSFVEYEQWRVHFNPGANHAVVLDELASAELDTRSFFYNAVIKDMERELHNTLDQDLRDLKATLEKIEYYRTTLGGVAIPGDASRLIVPPLPKLIDGDEVTGDPGEKVEPDPNDTATQPSDTASAGVTEKAPEMQGSTLQLVTDHVMSRGVDLDWRNTTVYEGFFDELAPAGKSGVEWMAELSKQQRSDDDVINREEWRVGDNPSDATLLSEYADANNPAMRTINDNIGLLRQSYEQYAKQKTLYQVDHMRELLLLELQLDLVSENHEVATSDELLVLY